MLPVHETEVIPQIHRRDGYRCRFCNRNNGPLHVHHRTYATYAEERLEDLLTLCRGCHEYFHRLSEAS
jgi:5-methylcytosine-specific restriction endonuclease McrA